MHSITRIQIPILQKEKLDRKSRYQYFTYHMRVCVWQFFLLHQNLMLKFHLCKFNSSFIYTTSLYDSWQHTEEHIAIVISTNMNSTNS